MNAMSRQGVYMQRTPSSRPSFRDPYAEYKKRGNSRISDGNKEMVHNLHTKLLNLSTCHTIPGNAGH